MWYNPFRNIWRGILTKKRFLFIALGIVLVLALAALVVISPQAGRPGGSPGNNLLR